MALSADSSSSETEHGISSPTEYVYQPLRSDKSVRLLLLQPGSRKTNDVTCELIEVDLRPRAIRRGYETKRKKKTNGIITVDKDPNDEIVTGNSTANETVKLKAQANDQSLQIQSKEVHELNEEETPVSHKSTNNSRLATASARPVAGENNLHHAFTSPTRNDATNETSVAENNIGRATQRSATTPLTGAKSAEHAKSTVNGVKKGLEDAEKSKRKKAQAEANKVPSLGENGVPTFYEAMSWSWGTDPWDARIHIKHGHKVYYHKAPQTLLKALRALRYKNDERVLWADAICINQQKIDERNQQVPMMADIYGKAQSVCVWLGDDDEDSKVAFKFISQQVVKLQDFDKLCESPDSIEKWNAMLNLMKRPWFSRRWVVQEISLATSAMLFCGRQKLPWAEFSDAVQLFVGVETATHRLSEVMRLNEKFYHVPRWFEYVSALGASLLVEATSTLFRQSQDGHHKPLLSLEYLVSALSAFEASEPRDTIYALLAIARDTTPFPIIRDPREPVDPKNRKIVEQWGHFKLKRYKVDYEKLYVDVCEEFLSFAIHQQDERVRALDIMCRPWAPPTNAQKGIRGKSSSTQQETMPSWIPQLSGAAFAMFDHADGQRKMGRINADPLVGLPLVTQRNYSAAGDEKVELHRIRFKTRVPALTQEQVDEQKRSKDSLRARPRIHSMFVRGFILDTVERAEVASQSGNIPRKWFETCKTLMTELEIKQKADHQAVREEEKRSDQQENNRPIWAEADNNINFPPDWFWRTLVADRTSDGRNPPSYYARACKMSLKKGLISGSLNTTDLIDNGRCSIVSNFFRRVQTVIWNRSLIVTTDSKNLGIAQDSVKPGDFVCILYGCSVPVIMRAHQKTQQDYEVEQKEREEPLDEVTKVGIQKFFFKWRDICRRALAEKNAIEKWKQEKGVMAPTQSRRRYQEKGWKLWVKPTMDMHKPDKQMLPLTADWCRKHPEHFYCEFLGESYVHGMMDGEALHQRYADRATWLAKSMEEKKVNPRPFPEQLFELR